MPGLLILLAYLFVQIRILHCINMTFDFSQAYYQILCLGIAFRNLMLQ